MSKILQEGVSYTFRSYVELPQDTDEILAEFGYDHAKTRLQLPMTQRDIPGLDDLKAQIEETLPYVQLTSESAKREVLIAPVMMRVATLVHQILRFEYPLKVNDWLQDSLNYLIRGRTQIVVVENCGGGSRAGRPDPWLYPTSGGNDCLGNGRNHPRYDLWCRHDGNLWIFGRLNRQAKRITQDIGGYQVPDNVEALVKTLVGILEQDSA